MEALLLEGLRHHQLGVGLTATELLAPTEPTGTRRELLDVCGREVQSWGRGGAEERQDRGRIGAG